MTEDLAWINPPAPQTAGRMDDLVAGLESWRPSLGGYLGANVAEGWWGSVLGQARATGRITQAEALAPDEDLAQLDQDAWRASPFYREAVPYRPGLTIAAARTLADIHDENQARRSLMAARQPGWGEIALGFGAGVMGSLPSPENFIPFAGPAMNLARAQTAWRGLSNLARGIEAMQAGRLAARAGAGAITGAVDATLGNLAIAPFTYPSRASFGDDVGWLEIVQDLAFGAAGGALLGGTFAAALGRAQSGRQGVAAIPLPGHLAERPGASPQAADEALRGLTLAADQVAAGGDVNLAMAPPEVRAALEQAHAELARLRAANPELAGGTGVADRAAARPLMASGQAGPDATWRATTPAGTEVSGRYEVVEARDLVTSHTADFQENPAFAQELQPRNRGREEAQAQVANIAARLRPEEVEASPSTTTGAPIIGPDGLVESGNGRTMAIRQAYGQQLPTAAAYRAFLVRLGFDKAATMEAPVLVRRRTTELDAAGRRRFAAESNADTVARMTPGEQARVDAGRLTPQDLALLQPGELGAVGNAGFIRAFVQALPDSERGAVSSGGELTPDGAQRIQRALAARAYGDAALIRRLAESRDGAGEAIGRALLDAAPILAKLRALIETGQVRQQLDAIPALVRAVQRIQAARDANLPLRSVLDQLDMFGDGASPAERAWLVLLLRHPVKDEVGTVGRDTLAARLDAYARAAVEAPNEPDMFGGPPPGLGDVMRVAFREAGIDAPAELRALTADHWSPPDEPPPPPPPGEGGPREASPIAKAAERQGFDVDAIAAETEARRLAEAGLLPRELVDQLDQADELVTKTERAGDAFQAAAACAIRG